MGLLQKDSHVGSVVMGNPSALISSRLASTTIALRHEIQKLLKK